jgi:hypothetical protein
MKAIIALGIALALSLQAAPVRAEEPATPPSAAAEKPAEGASAAAPAEVKKTYHCEKCGVSKDAPGKCEKCGADLVEKAAEAPKEEPKKDEAPKTEEHKHD